MAHESGVLEKEHIAAEKKVEGVFFFACPHDDFSGAALELGAAHS